MEQREHRVENLRDYAAAKHIVLRGRAAWMQASDCPDRKDVRWQDGRETACCDRLARLIGSAQLDWCEVRRDVCDACCRSDAPVRSGINPVIASLLYVAASKILQRGGTEGCDVAKASLLQQLGEDNLQCVFPSGDGPPNLNGDRSSDEESNTPPVMPPPLSELIPIPTVRCGSAVSSWAVGVTTSPRKEPTLDRCLHSLIRAGWERPRLFVDGGTQLVDGQTDLPVTYREEKVGAWSNFYLALLELLMRQPDADAYLLVQDDALFYDGQNVREYLESSLWPDSDVAAVSLYCPQPYTRRQPGWYALDGLWVWGAQAFVFSNSAARQFAVDQQVFEHRWAGWRTDAQIDVLIGNWARRLGRRVHYPVPSLVQHIGQTSTLWPAGRTTGKRRASWFLGAGSPSPDSLPETCVQPAEFPPVHHGVSLSKLVVVTSVFDAQHCPRWLENYTRFFEDLRAHGIELVTVEGVLRGEQAVLPSGDHVLHLPLDSVLWHKERLLNLGISSLGADVDAVGWFDADILVRHDDLQRAILAALGAHPVIQPWRCSEWLDADGQYVPWGNRRRWMESLASKNWTRPPDRRCASPSFGHPGLAWAARRETFETLGGLFDQHPVGGGDTMMAVGFWGDWQTPYLDKYNDAMRQVFYVWGRRAYEVVRGNVGLVDAAVTHLWHGSRQSRKYAERTETACSLGLDPARHLQPADNGTWKWADQTPETIVQFVAGYFTGRREDAGSWGKPG
jgi:hypothetical protein